MCQLQYPPTLEVGDTIAIVSPASFIAPERIDGAVATLRGQGYRVRVMPHAYNHCGSFAGTYTNRLADLSEALTDPNIKAILCSRGGYGCVQLLPELARLDFGAKWLVGFSDVTALHQLMRTKGIVSIHGSMAKALAEQPADSKPNAMLLQMLRGQRPSLSFASGAGSVEGSAEGTLVGGNLAVLQALIRTPFDPFAPGTILFIEDIAEPIYKVERMLLQLRMAGVLDNLAGLIIGRFTDYKPDKNHTTVEQMIRNVIFADHSPAYPVAFDAPIGHFDDNMPLLHAAHVKLSVDSLTTTIEYII